MRHVWLLLAMVGCGTSISATGINAPPHAMTARPPAALEVYSSGVPERPHVDVAIFEAEQSSVFSDDGSASMLAKLRRAAAALGCDAIVIGGATSRTVGKASLRGFFATCVVYRS